MTEQEFRKLKALDLIQILLAQGAEAAEQQRSLEKKNKRLKLLLEENDIIKAKLNDRDAMTDLIKLKLNESDAYIRELEEKMKELYSDKQIALEETGSLVQAALQLNQIFEAAQREAEQYIQNAEPLIIDAEASGKLDVGYITEEKMIEEEAPEEQNIELSGETKEPESGTETEEPEIEEPEIEEPESEAAEKAEEPEQESGKGLEESEKPLEGISEETSESEQKPEAPKQKGLFGFLRRRKK